MWVCGSKATRQVQHLIVCWLQAERKETRDGNAAHQWRVAGRETMPVRAAGMSKQATVHADTLQSGSQDRPHLGKREVELVELREVSYHLAAIPSPQSVVQRAIILLRQVQSMHAVNSPQSVVARSTVLCAVQKQRGVTT